MGDLSLDSLLQGITDTQELKEYKIVTGAILTG